MEFVAKVQERMKYRKKGDTPKETDKFIMIPRSSPFNKGDKVKVRII